MSEQWEGLLEGAAADLHDALGKVHLADRGTLKESVGGDGLTALQNRDGDQGGGEVARGEGVVGRAEEVAQVGGGLGRVEHIPLFHGFLLLLGDGIGIKESVIICSVPRSCAKRKRQHDHQYCSCPSVSE